MPNETVIDDVVRGGHAHAMLPRGPFEIGVDFAPPAPVGSILYRIDLDADTVQKLERCIARGLRQKRHGGDQTEPANNQDDANTFDHTMRQLALKNGVAQALAWYVNAMQFQPEESEVRKQLGRIMKAVDRLATELSSFENGAAGRFLYETYTGEIFLKDELKPSDARLVALQEEWRDRLGPYAVLDTLSSMHRCVSAAEEMMGKTRSTVHRVRTLVRALASVWLKATGAPPISGRHWKTGKQVGPFADFVRAALDVLPSPFAEVSLETSIRDACKPL